MLTSESHDKGIELRLACRPTSESHDEDVDLELACWPRNHPCAPGSSEVTT